MWCGMTPCIPRVTVNCGGLHWRPLKIISYVELDKGVRYPFGVSIVHSKAWEMLFLDEMTATWNISDVPCPSKNATCKIPQRVTRLIFLILVMSKITFLVDTKHFGINFWKNIDTNRDKFDHHTRSVVLLEPWRHNPLLIVSLTTRWHLPLSFSKMQVIFLVIRCSWRFVCFSCWCWSNEH